MKQKKKSNETKLNVVSLVGRQGATNDGSSLSRYYQQASQPVREPSDRGVKFLFTDSALKPRRCL